MIIAQWPNAPLWLWIAMALLQRLPFNEPLIHLFNTIGFGAIFVWAWLELFEGVNLFRRLLGFVVLVGATISRVGF